MAELNGLSSKQFYMYYGNYIGETGAAMHIKRKPGEPMEIDWAG